MSFFERLEKYLPPPLTFLCLIGVGWYSLSHSIKFNNEFNETISSGIFRYGLPSLFMILIFAEIRSRRKSLWEVIKERSGILPTLTAIGLLAAASVPIQGTIDIYRHLSARSAGRLSSKSEETISEAKREVIVTIQGSKKELAVVIMPYGWTQDGHYDLLLDRLRVPENSQITLPLGLYRFVLLNTLSPELFHEVDVLLDRLSPKKTRITLEIPEWEQVHRTTAQMARIPSSTTVLGNDNTGPAWGSDRAPARSVYLRSYFVDRFETTREEYSDFIKENHYRPPRVWTPDRGDFDGLGRGFPVSGVSWYDAMEYARYRRKRLPIEAEWERAAKMNGSAPYPWGNEYNDERWVQVRYESELTVQDLRKLDELPQKLLLRRVLESKERSDLTDRGVAGLAGNVREWCLDQYRNRYNTAETGAALKKYRIIRGGFKAKQLSPLLAARADFRNYGRPTKGYANTGIRLVRSADYNWVVNELKRLKISLN